MPDQPRTPTSSPAPVPGSQKAVEWQARRERQDRATKWAAASFLFAMASALALFVIYVQGGQTQLEGLALFGAFGGVGLGLGIWVRVILDEPHVVEPRKPAQVDPDEARQSFKEVFAEAMGEASIGGRRRFLLRLLYGVVGSLGLALLIPLRSLGPGPRSELFDTPWRRGKRLVTAEGEELKADDVGVDQVVTVFPADAVGSADGQAVLVGLRPDRPSSNDFETVDNLACYSKICTHAGCPVGLYRARAGELLCPCHQSTFDVYDGAKVLSGPTGRPLPHLPIGVDDEGYLIALDDFSAPVGPSFWNLDDDPDVDGDDEVAAEANGGAA